ncbi:MAG TPA: hypothetical protein VHD55_02355 [Candidatus Paceibacterota bacterium]|nr:hypothetical protein [Candidatus Paceibacterota bacterium]
MVLHRSLSGLTFIISIFVFLFALAIFFPPSFASAGGGGGGSGGGGASCPPFATDPPAVAAVPGYKPAGPTLYEMPGSLGYFDAVVPTVVKRAWYNKMPSAGVCGGQQMGLCMTDNFSVIQGTKIAALTASMNIKLGKPAASQVSIDAVTKPISNNCGQTSTLWSYVLTPSAGDFTMKVPKGVSIDLTYSCQPNQTYTWETHTSCFLGIGNCNVRQHARSFMFADRAVSNIPSGSSGLSGTKTFVPQEGTSYSLACGGYRPENGSATPPTYGSASSAGGVCFLGIDCDSGGDFSSYNVKDSSYQQPPLAMSVEACTGDDEVVVNNVCTPCSQVLPGSWRIENICVTSLPVVSIDAFVNGKSVSTTTPGIPVTIRATYVSTTSDPIAGAVINGGTKGKDTPACTGSCMQTTYSRTKATATTTYTFTPSASGVFTFYPSVQTKLLAAWSNYGDVSKTLIVGNACPANATPSGSSCTCNDKYSAYIGNACVLTCPATMHPNMSGSTCIANLPTSAMLDFTALRVREGARSTLSWTIRGMQSGIACDIAPRELLESPMPAYPGGSTWSGALGTTPIKDPTRYTLSCTNGEETVSKTTTVQLIPEYQEI